jgi:hypothetical protein
MRPSYVVLNGGLGNQLWQLAFAHKLAESRSVKVVQIINKNNQDNHLKRGAEVVSEVISMCSHRITFESYDFRNPFIRGKFIPESNWSTIWKKSQIDSRNCDWYDLNKIDTSGSFVHLGFYQSLQYLKDYVSTVLAEFRMLLTNRENVIQEESVKDYAVIHLRGGDYYQARHRNIFGILDKTYYSKLTNEIANQGFERAYVITDDWKSAIDRLSDIRQIDLIYLDRANEITTMHAMSRAKVVGIANSSFSWWGGMLSKGNGGIMYAPNPWFKYQIKSGENFDVYESGIFKITSSFLDNDA